MLGIARLVVGLLWDVLRLAVLLLRPPAAVGAENLILRRQLGRFVERGIKPRRVDHVTRASLALFSRLCDWRKAVIIVRHGSAWPKDKRREPTQVGKQPRRTRASKITKP